MISVRCNPGQRVVEIRYLFRYQFQLICRQILGEDASLAVKNETAGRRQRLDANTVAVRFFGEQFVLDHLQLH